MRVSMQGSGRVASARSGGRRSRAGFSLVEIVAAIVILSFGVLGLASSSAFIARQMAGGATHVTAAMVAQSRIEALRSRTCASLTNGTATTRNIGEAWTVTAGSNNTRIITVSVTLPRRTRAENYTSIIAC